MSSSRRLHDATLRLLADPSRPRRAGQTAARPKHIRVSEIKVPALVENSFRTHYRNLVLGSLLHAADREALARRSCGQAIRARRAERAAVHVRRLLDISAPARRGYYAGPKTRAAVCVLWLSAAGLLAGSLAVEGFRSRLTGGADLGVIAATFAWFFTPPARPAQSQLQLFEP